MLHYYWFIAVEILKNNEVQLWNGCHESQSKQNIQLWYNNNNIHLNGITATVEKHYENTKRKHFKTSNIVELRSIDNRAKLGYCILYYKRTCHRRQFNMNTFINKHQKYSRYQTRAFCPFIKPELRALTDF